MKILVCLLALVAPSILWADYGNINGIKTTVVFDAQTLAATTAVTSSVVVPVGRAESAVAEILWTGAAITATDQITLTRIENVSTQSRKSTYMLPADMQSTIVLTGVTRKTKMILFNNGVESFTFQAVADKNSTLSVVVSTQ